MCRCTCVDVYEGVYANHRACVCRSMRMYAYHMYVHAHVCEYVCVYVQVVMCASVNIFECVGVYGFIKAVFRCLNIL